jgi:cell division septum initiation protein DivIVA
MDIDRQAIERRDFPIARRGYEPAAVDAHLRALAAELEALARQRGASDQSSLAAAASSQVQSILHAAESAAADIEREAKQSAEELLGEAERDARRTREEAIAKAREHAASITQATDILLQRVGSLDGEASALLGRLREGAERLARDLSALDANMGALYDASSGRASTASRARAERAAPPREPAESSGRADTTAGEPPAHRPTANEAPAAVDEAGSGGDIDGARLVALNMALSGEPRGVTERYLAEHFQLSDSEKLIDEVYAAVEA